MLHTSVFKTDLPLAILDVCPNPVLVKNAKLEYVWVNRAFEALFSVKRDVLIGRLDVDLFPDRQSAQCNGGDMRVLDTGVVDEAYETVFTAAGEPRETVTRKSKLVLPTGEVFLVGVMHDVTDVMTANAALESAKTRLEEQTHELQRLANTDHLTGCLNRRALFEQGIAAIGTKPFAALILDLDDFKRVNDTFGHAAGDAALIHFTQIVGSTLDGNALFARLGGEEFVVILPDCSKCDAEAAARQIVTAVRGAPYEEAGERINLTVSVGGAWTASLTTPVLDPILSSADHNLYCAKKTGRDQAVVSVMH